MFCYQAVLAVRSYSNSGFDYLIAFQSVSFIFFLDQFLKVQTINRLRQKLGKVNNLRGLNFEFKAIEIVWLNKLVFGNPSN